MAFSGRCSGTLGTLCGGNVLATECALELGAAASLGGRVGGREAGARALEGASSSSEKDCISSRQRERSQRPRQDNGGGVCHRGGETFRNIGDSVLQASRLK